MPRVVTLGEVMLRLRAPGFERLFQTPFLEATFGGAEANVAVSLANYGLAATFVSAVPRNVIGDACLAELRGFGVDVSFVRRQGDRLGIYFLEGGANQRPSRVTYGRAGSAIAAARPEDFDWGGILEGAAWLHVSGVTPAISASAADLALYAARQARARGIPVSVDYNYRKNLWKWGRSAPGSCASWWRTPRSGSPTRRTASRPWASPRTPTSKPACCRKTGTGSWRSAYWRSSRTWSGR
jgi:2-dehydro-3-deoxygluconokinase